MLGLQNLSGIICRPRRGNCITWCLCYGFLLVEENGRPDKQYGSEDRWWQAKAVPGVAELCLLRLKLNKLPVTCSTYIPRDGAVAAHCETQQTYQSTGYTTSLQTQISRNPTYYLHNFVICSIGVIYGPKLLVLHTYVHSTPCRCCHMFPYSCHIRTFPRSVVTGKLASIAR